MRKRRVNDSVRVEVKRNTHELHTYPIPRDFSIAHAACDTSAGAHIPKNSFPFRDRQSLAHRGWQSVVSGDRPTGRMFPVTRPRGSYGNLRTITRTNLVERSHQTPGT